MKMEQELSSVSKGWGRPPKKGLEEGSPFTEQGVVGDYWVVHKSTGSDSRAGPCPQVILQGAGEQGLLGGCRGAVAAHASPGAHFWGACGKVVPGLE